MQALHVAHHQVLSHKTIPGQGEGQRGAYMYFFFFLVLERRESYRAMSHIGILSPTEARFEPRFFK